MKTKAVRLYGKRDLRLEEFELPQIREDEILNVVAAIEAFYRSAETGREVRVDELEGVK